MEGLPLPTYPVINFNWCGDGLRVVLAQGLRLPPGCGVLGSRRDGNLSGGGGWRRGRTHPLKQAG